MHIIYKDIGTMVLTFLVGLVWGTIFMRTHNLYVVTLSHAVLGAVAIMLGVI
jgi:membrane protease YdiL (CAAX protease family)